MCGTFIGRAYRNHRGYITICYTCTGPIISSSSACGRIPSSTAYWNVCQDYAFFCGCIESCSFTILVLDRNETTLLTRFPQLYRTERHRGNPITCSASYRRWRNRDTSYGSYSYADTDVDRDGTCCSDCYWTSSDRRWSFHPGSCFVCGGKCHFHILNSLLRIKPYDKNFQSLYSVVDRILGAPGFFLSIAVLFYYLCALKPMGVPYLWPAVPFFPQAMLRVLIRFPMTADAPRPFITDSPDRDRIS